ncbi:MAG: cytochrome c-type biogenesis protein, partial [Pseudomonadota bacterium]
QRLIGDIRCVTCQNMTIKDSNVFLAADLRREVREQIAAGRTDQEIFDFLTARYGDFVLYTTPLNERTWAFYAVPPLLLLFGALVAWRTVRRRAALPMDDLE